MKPSIRALLAAVAAAGRPIPPLVTGGCVVCGTHERRSTGECNACGCWTCATCGLLHYGEVRPCPGEGVEAPGGER